MTMMQYRVVLVWRPKGQRENHRLQSDHASYADAVFWLSRHLDPDIQLVEQKMYPIAGATSALGRRAPIKVEPAPRRVLARP